MSLGLKKRLRCTNFVVPRRCLTRLCRKSLRAPSRSMGTTAPRISVRNSDDDTSISQTMKMIRIFGLERPACSLLHIERSATDQRWRSGLESDGAKSHVP